MRISKNPTVNRSVTLTTLSFTSTGTDGVVNGSGFGDLERGQSVILQITGGTFNGFTTLQEYFVIPVSATQIKLASTKSNAIDGVSITTTGDAGAGTLNPSYRVSGVLYVGTLGDINVKGVNSKEFSVMKNIDGWVPAHIGELNPYLTTAEDIVVWEE